MRSPLNSLEINELLLVALEVVRLIEFVVFQSKCFSFVIFRMKFLNLYFLNENVSIRYSSYSGCEVQVSEVPDIQIY